MQNNSTTQQLNNSTTRRITPVLIVGLNRNGTTWMGNILSQCFRMTGPRHDLHYGFCEVNLYDNGKHWGDFSNLNQYIHFLDNYCPADVFKILEGDRKYFEEKHAANFYEFFFETIDQFTQKQGNQYWVAKLDPGFFHDPAEFEVFKRTLHERYNKPKFILIQREYNDYIRSYINMIGEAKITRNTSLKKRISGITGTMFYHYFYRKMNHLLADKDVLKLPYENLKNDFEGSLQQIASFVEYPDAPMPYALRRNVQNTSFTGKKKQQKDALIGLSNVVFKNIPPLTSLAVGLRYRFQKKSNLPPLWWRLTKAERFPKKLEEELKMTEQFKLLEFLKDEKLGTKDKR